MPARVLLVSHRGDPYTTGLVHAALTARGAHVLRLDTDQAPLHSAISVPDRGPPRIDGVALDADAAWIWRVWSPTLPDAMPAAHRASVTRETHALLDGLLASIEPWRVLDLPGSVSAAGKLRQLRLAHAAGLHVVPTLHTSDPDAARAFFDAQDGDVVVKLHEQPAYGLQTGQGFATRRLRPEDRAQLDGLRYGPMILQRSIPKAWELRIAWVDGQAFTGALHGPACGDDWRYARGDNPWRPWTLDPDVHASIGRLMAKLGLRQGAVDLIVTPTGEHAFLEVNPTGEWGMLHRDLGLPIHEALADALLREPAP